MPKLRCNHMNAHSSRTQKKDRLRGPDIAIFIREGKEWMEKALGDVEKAELVIASNRRLSQAISSGEWKKVKIRGRCWSGTMVAYDRPDHKVGETIEYTDSRTNLRYVFPVPEEHRGKKNIALVAEHPDFMLEKDGNDRIIKATEVGAVERFPITKGWYMGDSKYGIPQGETVAPRTETKALYLLRTEMRVSLAARGGKYGIALGSVDVANSPCMRFGMVVEVPDKEEFEERFAAPKIYIKGKEVSMEKALERASKTGRVIVPNIILRDALNEGDWATVQNRRNHQYWSGTLVGYDKPNRPLGDKIVQIDEDTGI